MKKSRELNCPLETGMRPCECELPRCPICGYTEHDARFEGDHYRCKGIIPPKSHRIETTETIVK